MIVTVRNTTSAPRVYAHFVHEDVTYPPVTYEPGINASPVLGDLSHAEALFNYAGTGLSGEFRKEISIGLIEIYVDDVRFQPAVGGPAWETP